MGDNKVNMSLDDIIKMNKKTRNTMPKKGAQRGNVRTNGGATSKGKKFVTPKKGAAVTRTQRLFANNKGKPGAIVANAQTKKLVSQLVKKALKTRLGGSLAARRAAVAGSRLRFGNLPNHGATANLGRVAARSRVITRSRPAITRALPVIVSPRGRGFRNNNLYQDEIATPVVVRQRPRARPIVVERIVQAPPRIIQRVVQRPQQQRVIRMQAQPIQQRPRTQQRRVVMVERQAPARQQRIQIQRVQRPQIIRQRPIQSNVQFVPARAQKNNAFRTRGRVFTNRNQPVQRFEPATTFITRKIVRRGRGFEEF